MSDRKSDSGSKSTLEIILEFGHKAVLKDVPSRFGDICYTHDWEIWVKNPNDGKIENFLEKAVFTLHPTFEPQTRTVTKAPFKVSEQGYGSFQISIDLYFKVSFLIAFRCLRRIKKTRCKCMKFTSGLVRICAHLC